MNDFNKWLAENKDKVNNVTADDVRKIMAKSDEQEKALCVMLHTIFTKKRKSTTELIRTIESFDMMLNAFRTIAPDKFAKDLSEHALIVNNAKELISSIDNVISALQQYSSTNEKFNEAIRSDINAKEAFKNNLETKQDDGDDEPHSGRYPWGNSLDE